MDVIKEANPALDQFQAYCNGRLKTAQEASPLARILQTSRDLRIYTEQLAKSAQEIAGSIQIPPNLFKTRVNAELFLAVSDGWVRNDHWSGSTHDETQRKYLLAVAKLLCQGVAESPPRSNPQERTKTDKEYFDSYQDHLDPDSSQALQQLMSDTGPESLLSRVRKAIGPGPTSFENPFKVNVLGLSREKTVNPNTGKKDSGWIRVTGEHAGLDTAAFTWVNLHTNERTVFFPKDIADSAQNPKERAVIGHEYIHTQLSLLAGVGFRMGSHFNEYAAAFFSGSTGHAETILIMDILNVLSGMTLTPNLRGSARVRLPEAFYQYFANKFGYDNLILMAATIPQTYNNHLQNILPIGRDLQSISISQLLLDSLVEYIYVRDSDVYRRVSRRVPPDWKASVVQKADKAKIKLPQVLAEALLE